MPTAIDRRALDGLRRDGARLIEVLPAAEYQDEHIPGAVNIPLRGLDARAVESFDRNAALVVYCWDAL